MKKEKRGINLKKEAFSRIEQMHPHAVLLYVGMIGSAIIFLFTAMSFSIAWLGSGYTSPIDVPKTFMLGTVIFLFSAFSISKVLPAFEEDNIEDIKKWLGVSVVLGLAFLFTQLAGWQSLKSHPTLFEQPRVKTTLYVISSLHLVHALAIIAFAVRLLLECHKTSKDVVRQLVYATNPYQKVKFKLLTNSWYFVNAVWLALFFYFLFTL